MAEGHERGHPFGTPLTEAILDDLDANDWELYDLSRDPAECHNVAAEYSEKLAELRDLWWSEAERYGILPLAATELGRLMAQRPMVGGARKIFTFFAGGSPISFAASPRVTNRAHSITAYATIPQTGAQGVLLTQGNRHGGYALYVADNRLCFVHNYLSLEKFSVIASEPLPRGAATLRMEFAPTGPPVFFEGHGSPAEVRLFYNDDVVGFGVLPFSVPVTFSTTGASCGLAYFDSVDPSVYEAPFPFTGDLEKVILDVTGELIIHPTAELTRLMTQQ
jgi:arylsulfatase